MPWSFNGRIAHGDFWDDIFTKRKVLVLYGQKNIYICNIFSFFFIFENMSGHGPGPGD